jgi:hypothetical protein
MVLGYISDSFLTFLPPWKYSYFRGGTEYIQEYLCSVQCTVHMYTLVYQQYKFVNITLIAEKQLSGWSGDLK